MNRSKEEEKNIWEKESINTQTNNLMEIYACRYLLWRKWLRPANKREREQTRAPVLLTYGSGAAAACVCASVYRAAILPPYSTIPLSCYSLEYWLFIFMVLQWGPR